MASVVLTGDTSGTLTVSAPLVAGSNTQTLVATTDTLAPIVRGTAVASTSGTSIDFTGIPSWVKRITVMFSGVSTNGSSPVQIQLGAGSVQTTSYLSGGAVAGATNAAQGGNSTNGMLIEGTTGATVIRHGSAIISSLGSNIWVMQSVTGRSDSTYAQMGGASVTLSGTLDRVRITTVNGTDTFDAGSINILYE